MRRISRRDAIAAAALALVTAYIRAFTTAPTPETMLLSMHDAEVGVTLKKR